MENFSPKREAVRQFSDLEITSRGAALAKIRKIPGTERNSEVAKR